MTGSNEENCPFSAIDNFIILLEDTKTALDKTFESLQGMTQAQVDKIIIEEINPSVNAGLKKGRDNLLSSLQSMYSGMLKLKEKLTPIEQSDPTAFSLNNLTAIIDAVVAIKDFLLTAYDQFLLFTVKLTEHVSRLTAAINDLVSYTPNVQGISFDKLDISVEPISFDDITGGTAKTGVPE